MLRAPDGSSSRVDVAGSGCSGPGLALQVERTSWAPTLRPPTSSPTRQPDAEPTLLVRGSPRYVDIAPAERAAQRVAALPPAGSRGGHGALRSRADVAGSGCSGPGPALRVERMSWAPTLRARLALLHGSRTLSRRSWSAARRAKRTSRRRSARPLGSLRCRRRGHVAATGPNGGLCLYRRVDTRRGHGDM